MLERRQERKQGEKQRKFEARLRAKLEEAQEAKERLKIFQADLQQEEERIHQRSEAQLDTHLPTQQANEVRTQLKPTDKPAETEEEASSVQELVQQWINVGKKRGGQASKRAHTGILDSGATGHFLRKGEGEATGKASDKVVGLPDGRTVCASQQVRLPLAQLNAKAREGDELPSLHNNLVSVPKLSKHGYTTIFHPNQEGVDVYRSDEVEIVPMGEPVLRGWQEANGLWRVPLRDEQEQELEQDEVRQFKMNRD